MANASRARTASDDAATNSAFATVANRQRRA
jgi:hypothetical protein